MKKLTATITIAALCLVSQSTTLLAADNTTIPNDIPQICLNGSYIESDIEPIIKDGRVLAPIKELGEALDIAVDWHEKSGEITVKKRDTNIKLTIDSNLAGVNERVVTLDTTPQMVDNQVFVPLRFVGESLGLAVFWNDTAKSAILQETYSATNGTDEVVLIPTNADTDSPYMIYHRMRAVINGVAQDYSWDWQASNWRYIAYTEPSIYWADVNGDNEDEIIIVLTDGVNRGTGVLLQTVHVLDKLGTEIMVDDAGEYAAGLYDKNNSADTLVENWTHYTVNAGKLSAEIAVVEQGEPQSLQLTYQYIAGKMQITKWEYIAEE